MSNDEPHPDEDLEVVEDVDWQIDDDGTEYFVEDGQRWELGEDGYAYAVGPADDPDGPAPSPFSAEGEAARGGASSSETEAAATTTEMPTVRIDSGGATSAASAGVLRPTSRARQTLSGGNGSAPSLSARPRTPAEGAGPSASTRPSGEPLLELQGLTSGYGSLPVLHGVDLAIHPGETAVMLGLNGAGKTTTAMNICGALKSWGGRIVFEGEDITALGTKKAVEKGIVMVPEGRRVFPELSVRKNLQVGAWSQRRRSDWFDEQLERVVGYFPRLGERQSQLAGTLSGGEQQMLAIGRGLMARPRLLIVDEASMGLAPVIVRDVFEIVRQINEDGTTVLMIEQNVGALEVADAAFVMEQGRIVKELRGEDVHDLDQVSEVLMG